MLFLLIACVFSTTAVLRSGATTPDPGCYTVTSAPSHSCLEKYQVVDDHIYCQLDPRMIHPSDAEMAEIASVHNQARSLVSPAAADMVEVKYSKGNERPALIWTQICREKTFTQYQRFLPGYTFMGLNTLVSSKNLTWTQVVNEWLRENSSFTYGASNDAKLVSNFTQIIWAYTSVVGCAKHVCPNGDHRYACSYAPGLEVSQINKPYTSNVSSCSACPGNCTNGLCDCNGILCLNGGVQDLNTCTCTCPSGNNYYEGLFCELYCKPNGDHVECGTTYSKASCTTNRQTAFHCPWMCDVCPYAGKNYTRHSVPLPYQRGKSLCTTPDPNASTTGTGALTRSSGNAGTTNATGSGANNVGQHGKGRDNGAASLQQSLYTAMVIVTGLFFMIDM